MSRYAESEVAYYRAQRLQTEHAQLRALLQEVIDTMDYTDDAPGCAFCGVGFDPDCPDFPKGLCHASGCLIPRITAALGEATNE